MNDADLAAELVFEQELEHQLMMIHLKPKLPKELDLPLMLKKCSLREYEKKYGHHPTNSFDTQYWLLSYLSFSLIGWQLGRWLFSMSKQFDPCSSDATANQLSKHQVRNTFSLLVFKAFRIFLRSAGDDGALVSRSGEQPDSTSDCSWRVL